MAINPAFWRSRKVFVTGHTGFKGGWLCLWLQHLGAHVAGFALAPDTTPSLWLEANVESAVRSTLGDIRDPQALAAALRAHQPEIVFHMAAQSLVRRSYEQPLETFATNIMGTAHLLETARQIKSIRAVVAVTSDKCYENRGSPQGYREDDPLGGHDPYSSSKACAELVTHAYRKSFFGDTGAAAIATARAGNVIGGGDWARDRLVPDIIRALTRGAAVDIRNPASTRPWQHVLDPLAGYLLLAQRLCEQPRIFEGAWNFGPDENDVRTVREIVESTCRLWGGNAAWRLDDAPQPHEAHDLSLDCSKARQALGWRPRLDIAQALQWTIEWYKDHHAQSAGARRVIEQQIARYQEGLARG